MEETEMVAPPEGMLSVKLPSVPVVVPELAEPLMMTLAPLIGELSLPESTLPVITLFCANKAVPTSKHRSVKNCLSRNISRGFDLRILNKAILELIPTK